MNLKSILLTFIQTPIKFNWIKPNKKNSNPISYIWTVVIGHKRALILFLLILILILFNFIIREEFKS